MSSLISRIEREAGLPKLTETLATGLAPSDLQSILLETFRRRAAHLTPAQVLSHYESNRFVQPSPVSPARLLAWEQIAYSSLPPEFQTVVLAPVTPLGTCSAIARVNQNWAVSTVRNTEVVSDSTNVLALECALRRRHLASNPKSSQTVHLAASHRLLRAQHFSRPNQFAHFSSFALCSAGRDIGHRQFEMAALGQHIRFYLVALQSYLPKGTPLRIVISDFATNAHHGILEKQLLVPLRSEFSDIEVIMDMERVNGRGYYIDLVFKVHASLPSGEWVELADGGCVNWTQQILSNSKERLLISGIGSERLCIAFPTNKDV
jgi:hypothetical protein